MRLRQSRGRIVAGDGERGDSATTSAARSARGSRRARPGRGMPTRSRRTEFTARATCACQSATDAVSGPLTPRDGRSVSTDNGRWGRPEASSRRRSAALSSGAAMPAGRAPAARGSAMPWRRADRDVTRAASSAAGRAAPRRRTGPRHRARATRPARCVRTGWRGGPVRGGRQAGAAGDRGLRPGRSSEPMWHAFGTPQVGVAVAVADHRPVAAVHHHLGCHRAGIVGGTHHRTIGTGIENRHARAAKPAPAACDLAQTCRRIRRLVRPRRPVPPAPRHRPRRPARCRARLRTSPAGSDRSSPRPAR